MLQCLPWRKLHLNKKVTSEVLHLNKNNDEDFLKIILNVYGKKFTLRTLNNFRFEES